MKVWLHHDLEAISTLWPEIKHIITDLVYFILQRLGKMYVSNAISMHDTPLLKAFVFSTSSCKLFY